MFGNPLAPDQYDGMNDEEKDRQAGEDADTLQKHASIVSHPPRHKKAVANLKTQQGQMKNALGINDKLKGHVKKGMSHAFPSDDETPFEKAGKNSQPGQEEA